MGSPPLRKGRRSGDPAPLPDPMAVPPWSCRSSFGETIGEDPSMAHADVSSRGWKRALYSLFRRPRVPLPADRPFVAATLTTFLLETFRRFADRTTIIRTRSPIRVRGFRCGPIVRGEDPQDNGGEFLLRGPARPYKGLETLLRAADRIPFRIAVIGTGPLDIALRRRSRLGVGGEGSPSAEWIPPPYYIACDSSSFLRSPPSRDSGSSRSRRGAR